MMSIGSYFSFVLSLVFVIGLIGLSAWAYRRFFMGRGIAERLGGGGRRIEVVEVRAVDARRRLVLVRRDAVEHLILLGANSETVVETGINRPTPADTGAGR